MEDERGHLIEIADLSAAALESRAARATAANTWDGTNPLGGSSTLA
jgi:hypothetical protein